MTNETNSITKEQQWASKFDYWLFNEYEFTEQDLKELDELPTN